MLAALALAGCGGAAREVVYAQPAELEPSAAAEAFSAWLHGGLALRAGDQEAAAQYFERAARAAPNDPVVRLRLAHALSLVDRFDDARLACRLAHDLDANPDAHAVTCAAVEERAGDVDAALALLAARANAEDTVGRPVYEAWLDSAYRNQRADDRLAAARAWAARYPEEPIATRAVGLALRDAGDHAAAARALLDAAMMPGGAGWDAEQAALSAMHVGDGGLAEAALDTCSARHREHLPCRVLRVQLLHGATNAPPGALDAALADLARRTAGERRRIGRTAADLGAFGGPDLVAAYVREVAAARPWNVGSLTTAAFAASSVGQNDLAVELMEQVLVADDANFDALNFIGYDWAERGIRLDEAEVYIREALFLRPGDPNITDSLAWVLYRRGEFADALALQRGIVAVPPENAVLLDHMGDICVALGDVACARKAFARALQIATPRDEDVLTTVPAKLEALPPAP